MTSPRFYCSEPITAHQTITLPESLSHHVRVLRLEAGCSVTLFDGRGGEITGTLDFNGKKAFVTLMEHRAREVELGGSITLLQGLPSGDKMDWVIEKAVELGATRLIPVAAQRSVLQLTGTRLEKRLGHWQRLIEAASEQCGRNRLMQIQGPLSLEQAMAQLGPEDRLLCHPEGGITLAEQLDRAQSSANTQRALTLIVGPEGGWSPKEIDTATRLGAQSVKFGERVLRTETAGLALISAATALLNW